MIAFFKVIGDIQNALYALSVYRGQYCSTPLFNGHCTSIFMKAALVP